MGSRLCILGVKRAWVSSIRPSMSLAIGPTVTCTEINQQVISNPTYLCTSRLNYITDRLKFNEIIFLSTFPYNAWKWFRLNFPPITFTDFVCAYFCITAVFAKNLRLVLISAELRTIINIYIHHGLPGEKKVSLYWKKLFLHIDNILPKLIFPVLFEFYKKLLTALCSNTASLQ